MNMQEVTQAFRSKMGDASGLGATLKFDCGVDGVVVLDGKATPNTVDNLDRPCDCTISISLENLNALMARELDPMMGFMTGKFKVEGDMSVAMKLQRVV